MPGPQRINRVGGGLSRNQVLRLLQGVGGNLLVPLNIAFESVTGSNFLPVGTLVTREVYLLFDYPGSWTFDSVIGLGAPAPSITISNVSYVGAAGGASAAIRFDAQVATGAGSGAVAVVFSHPDGLVAVRPFQYS